MNLQNILSAVTEALREAEKCPNDSVQDIFNEKFASWQVPLRMNHKYEIDIDSDKIVLSGGGRID